MDGIPVSVTAARVCVAVLPRTYLLPTAYTVARHGLRENLICHVADCMDDENKHDEHPFGYISSVSVLFMNSNEVRVADADCRLRSTTSPLNNGLSYSDCN